MKISEGHLLFTLATSIVISPLKLVLPSFSSELLFSKASKKGQPPTMDLCSLQE